MLSPSSTGPWMGKKPCTQGQALTMVHQIKIAAHADGCHSVVGVDFILMVIESLGGWREVVSDVIGAIGRLWGQRLGVTPAYSNQYLFQRLAFILRSSISSQDELAPHKVQEVDMVI